jgi:hypothetical protein
LGAFAADHAPDVEVVLVRDDRAACDRQRTNAYTGFIHFYNHHRTHGALGWSTPAATLSALRDNVPSEHTKDNVPGHHT